MTTETLRMAGILLVLVPTVAFGGETLLRLIYLREAGYMKSVLRRRLWIAGHAHAGVLLILSLVALLHVDSATLSDGLERVARSAVALSAPG